MPGILEGVRVLDFGRYIAGPYCTTILANLGAEVIRIEKLDGSEDRFTTPVTDTGEGGMLLQMGNSKKGLTLNPMKPEAREVLRRLVKSSDVVVANLPIETLEAMGLDYASLCKIKEDIILTHQSAFGDTGPYKNRVGFDGIGQAMSGAMYMSGDPQTGPRKLSSPWVDFTTAMVGCIGTLSAIMHHRATGEGQQVTGSLFGSSVLVSVAALIEQDMLGLNRTGIGNRGYNGGPSDTYKTKDGWVLVQSIGRPLFKRWCQLIGEDHWLSDSRFDTDQDRGDNGHLISERMAKWCLERTTQEAIKEMEAVRLPCGPVLSPQEVLDDPHLKAMELLQEVEYPGLSKPARIANFPVKMSKTEVSIKSRAPLLGEHTEEILLDLGFSADEITALRDARVV
ncbi:CaiB/BaiF CoA transferase family protein [Sneathiella glossodoripedis]|uniref:CaiB/BaiF CoA transferase family protein n=1 Tax=Sneathiella glossodoripedis TaxID=418853 RepID=UPI00046FCAF0|nr:CoA transferase [Sneathiella glossodoripedis]